MTSTEPRPDILTDRPDDPLGEALLLQAVRDGSTAAFGILYARYRPVALGVALRSLSSSDASMAEDVVEVAFIRVLTALRNGKGPVDTIRAYLTTTVRREAWRAQHRRRRQAAVVEQWAVDEDRIVDGDAALAAGSEADLSAHVLLSEAFRGLSDRWRHVLWLTEVEGHKPADVAPMLGVSAGSASALAYRARNGLVAAYVGAYRRSLTDASCLAIADRLGQYVAAGTPDGSFGDVTAHLEGCRSCREVCRGVDVLGTVLASFVPFGLLTVGWWAQMAGPGAAGLAGAGVAAGAVGASALAGQGMAGGTAAGGGVSAGAAVAAAVAVVAVIAAGVVGLRGGGAGEQTAAPARVSETVPSEGRPPTSSRVSRSSAGTDLATRRVPPAGRTDGPRSAAPGAVSTTSAPSSPSLPVATTSTTSAAPTTSTTVSSTTTTSTTTSPTTTTSTTVPPVVPAARLSGRAVKRSPFADGAVVPVPGVRVDVFDVAGDLVGTMVTGDDGRWTTKDLPAGWYVAGAVIPAAYGPDTGPDPWQGGATWSTTLGAVDLAGRDLDLVDLRLRDR